MSRVLALAEREVRAAFRSPVPYAVLGVHLLLHGLFYTQYLEQFSQRTQRLIAVGGLNAGHNLMDLVAQRLVMADTFLLVLLLPALTMRMLAEEWRTGSGDLLLSYPLREVDVVVGKYLAGAALLALMVVAGAAYPLSLFVFGHLEVPMLLANELGLFLFGMTILAVGLLFSTVTQNQVVAFVATVLTLLLLTFTESWATRTEPPLRDILLALSPLRHVVPYSYGVLRLSDALFLTGLSGVALYLAASFLGARRWRGGAATMTNTSSSEAAPEKRGKTPSWRGPRGLGGFALTTLLLVTALVLLFVLLQRHDVVLDVTAGARRTLAPETRQVLDLVDEPIDVLGFYANAPAEREQVRELLARYHEVNPRIRYDFVDLDRRPELAEAYDVTANQTLVLVRRDLRVKITRPDEAAISGALVRLLRDAPPRVLFVTGHGEGSIDDAGRGGLSRAADLLRRQNLAVESFFFPGAAAVPSGAAVLVVAAPEAAFPRSDRQQILDYLLRGGSLLAMVEPRGSAGLDTLLGQLGLTPREDFIVDTSPQQRNIAGPNNYRIALGQRMRPDHPVTAGFNLPTLYPLARSLISRQPPPPGARWTRLVETGPEAWGETDMSVLVEGRPAFTKDKDSAGPLAVVFAGVLDLRRFEAKPDSVERGVTSIAKDLFAGSFDARDSSRADTLEVGGQSFRGALPREARLVVTGDVSFIDNANLLVRGNSDLLLSAVLWLTQQDQRIALSPRLQAGDTLVLTARQRLWIRLLGIGLLPVACLSLCIGVVLRRRRWV